jgi:small subunit ribosomal protein S3
MGRKSHPSGLRIGLRSEWPSRWFATGTTYANRLIEDIRIRNTIMKLHNQAGVESIGIKRNANLLEVEIKTAKPGVIIGRGGAGARALKATVEGMFNKLAPKERPHVRITISEVKNPELSAQLIGENIARSIERRINVRRAVSQAMERAKERNVTGIKIKVSGRLNGAEIARSEYVTFGSVPLSTFRADIDYAMIHARTNYGVIGVKVWVWKGTEMGEVVDL